MNPTLNALGYKLLKLEHAKLAIRTGFPPGPGLLPYQTLVKTTWI